ncbi:hypothetical protein EDB83DRAFT_489704 [Lactarius deliciosus]|nr:hypothetical protein EDB83DRAFT_489704 [Lactarius deliciosus]
MASVIPPRATVMPVVERVALKREVSSYLGFKSTPRLETLFASRRLPRSYLMLLESFSSVSPVARLSCEKVLAALHLGESNPILPKSSLSDVLASRMAQVSRVLQLFRVVFPHRRLLHGLRCRNQRTHLISRLTPLPHSSAGKKRLPSPTRSGQGQWFTFSQQTSARALRALKLNSGIQFSKSRLFASLLRKPNLYGRRRCSVG